MTRILLVDDDDLVRTTLGTILRARGYEVRDVSHGAAALAALSNWSPDVVLTDLLMPEKDGIEVMLALRRQRPGLPIVLMSGGARVGNTDILVAAAKFGANQVLRKPMSADELVVAIEAAWAARQPG